MFAMVVMLGDVVRDSGFWSAQEHTAEGEAGDVLEYVGVFDSFGDVFAPGKRGVAGDKDAGDCNGVEGLGTEAADDYGAGIADVGLGDFGGGEGCGDGDGAMEVVGVGGAEARNGPAGLGP